MHSSVRGLVLPALVLAASIAAGCTATYFKAPVKENPLERIARDLESEGEYAVELSPDRTHLELRDTWVTHSIFALGWTVFRMNLDYREDAVFGECYLRSNGLGTLYLPTYVDCGSGFWGAVLRPIADAQRTELLGRMALEAGETTHSEFQDLGERVDLR